MSKHLHINVVTANGVSSSNRGENENGTLSTLQKLVWKGNSHTTISAEAIRYAMRESWFDSKHKTNRPMSIDKWADPEFKKPERYIDDDVLGFMHPSAKDDSKVRTGPFQCSKAVSLCPWTGEVSHNFASPSSQHNKGITKKTKEGTDRNVSNHCRPYQAEFHTTRYQYFLTLTPQNLLADQYKRTKIVVDTLCELSGVGGNQGRFRYDFGPEIIVLRWTDDPSPRIGFCFETDNEGKIHAPDLLLKVESGDVVSKDVVLGYSTHDLGVEDLGKSVKVIKGIKEAASLMLARIKEDLS